MKIAEIKKIYCIGIGGIGVSALARFFHTKGTIVSGSDVVMSDEIIALSQRGIRAVVPPSKKNIMDDIDVVIYSPAILSNDEELIEAQKRKIPALSYPEMLGQLTKEYKSIAVSGTNGKTTTTALLGKFLEAGDKDPTVILGGRVPGWDNNLRVGNSQLFVVESCEYKRNMLNLFPRVILLTNIEADHLDYYKNIADIKTAFSEYVSKLKKEDLLVYNIDDKNCRKVVSSSPARTISFGFSDNADICAKNIVCDNGEQFFELWVSQNKIGLFTTKIPGTFNIYNILGATATAHSEGVEYSAIQRALNNFTGIWRRFETVGKCHGATIISDYAHHPTAVASTLLAAREFFPKKKILAIFQPHHQNRTIKLFDDFVAAFFDADEIILAEIYHVCGREETSDLISSQKLVDAIKKSGYSGKISFVENISDIEKEVRKKLDDNTVALIMGAGDIDTVARNLSAHP
ncbi:UDP-N-acetylmuramate--L-alanine ligase [Patescibacteria group bacterium]|nr:UDP-N-acetylmuramate--L-alanine ligase [Patescibacteria group bacterium]MBU1246485.1 UDP-N-acetylmuramate--L-alanine ligase [Patescibacteria group bacterium]MBU1519435.1 UDP-N-acetylmuramate--L-alanine ligase [Patescibacteria group bacterium]MBU1730575.1 UDP-N-acetylmuramate--L-alanine ligase [Patescibacteria group bacterium]MBU1956226.1 UDP-N-acetylmuramate--L-alanine ligase [Patescibacteria group bacterium]